MAIVDESQLSEKESLKPHNCRFCGRRFATMPGVSRHIRESCKIAGSEAGMELLYEHTLKKQLDRQADEIVEMKTKYAQLEAQMQQLALPAIQQAVAPAVQQIAGGHIITGPSVHQNITVNIFGKEDTKHLNRTSVKEMLDDILAQAQSPAQAALTAMLKTATLIYSDPARPENLTCYLPNKKKEDVMVHGEAGWEIQSCPLVLPPMVTKSVDALFDNQPFEDASKYGDLMKALRANEIAYKEGKDVKTVLVRNKDLLEKALGALPK